MWADIWCVWPLSASTTSEVKNDHAHVITQDISNKFIEINFWVGCMVSQPNRLFQCLTTMSLINKILFSKMVPNFWRLCLFTKLATWHSILSINIDVLNRNPNFYLTSSIIFNQSNNRISIWSLLSRMRICSDSKNCV